MRVRPFAAALGALALLLAGAAGPPTESEVKAAFLFKFLSYVEWPASAFGGARSPFVIGTLEAEEVQVALAEMTRGRVAQGRPLEVRRLGAGETTEGLHALYVGRAATGTIPDLIGRPGMLVIGEAEDALDRGAMINLLRVDSRVRFEVAPAAAERSGLHISSRMLALAQSVRPVSP